MEAIEMIRIEKQKIGTFRRIINFENYIATSFRDLINIFELNDNLDINLKTSFSTGKFITNMDFNSKYKDILLTIPANDYIKLYNISYQNNFEVISILNGERTKDAHYAKFNPVYENQFFLHEFYLNYLTHKFEINRFLYRYNHYFYHIIQNQHLHLLFLILA